MPSRTPTARPGCRSTRTRARHHDYELTLLGATDGVFQPLFRQYQSDAITLRAAGASTEGTDKKFVLLSEFYGAAVAKLRTTARAVFLGQREQEAHPQEGWLDRDITTAVAAVKADWTTAERTSDLTVLAPSLAYIERSLAMPAVETRWDRVARLSAEAKAAASAGDGDTDSGS